MLKKLTIWSIWEGFGVSNLDKRYDSALDEKIIQSLLQQFVRHQQHERHY